MDWSRHRNFTRKSFQCSQRKITWPKGVVVQDSQKKYVFAPWPPLWESGSKHSRHRALDATRIFQGTFQSNQWRQNLTRVEAQGMKLWINQGKKLSTAPFSQRVFDVCSVCFQTKFHTSFAKITQPQISSSCLLSDDHEASFCRPKIKKLP